MPNRNPTVVYPPGAPRRSSRLRKINNPTTSKSESTTKSTPSTVRVNKSPLLNDEFVEGGVEGKRNERGGDEIEEGWIVEQEFLTTVRVNKSPNLNDEVPSEVVEECELEGKRKRKGGDEIEEGWIVEQELLTTVRVNKSPNLNDEVLSEAVEEGEMEGKRKRKGGDEIGEGWTVEQCLALKTAYSNFWNNVSEMVPGKSKQDCFDRVHRYFHTPPQCQPRSRAKAINSSSLHQFSVFSVLEPNIDLSTNDILPSQDLCAPKKQKENQGFLQICNEISSSSSIHKKSLSRFSGSSGVQDLASPPVLNQVKNKVQHEKYVNQSRSRDLRRRALVNAAAKVMKINERVTRIAKEMVAP